MNTLQNIKTSTNDGILIAAIDRPKSLNALNIQTIDELDTLISEVYQNNDIKALILTGTGEKAFVAGADITEIANLNEEDAYNLAQNGQQVFAKFENCSKPVIAAVNGFALGGGCELSMACHMRVASENAKFGQPEVNLGIVPGYGGTQRLTQLVGKGKALELMTTGDMVTAQEALHLGLINHVVSSNEELIPLATKIIHKILAKAPVAVGMVINCVNAYFAGEDGYQIEKEAFALCSKTEDFTEGTNAFLEKRKASFIGE